MKYSIILFASLFVFGCKGDPGPAGTALSGDITGTVNLYAENGQLISDRSNVHISIDNGFSSAITPPDGSWILHEIPAGVHTLMFSRTGFFTNKDFNFQFVGGGTYYWGTMYLWQIPSSAVKQLIITGPDQTNAFHIQGTLTSPESSYTYAVIIFDKAPISTTPTVTYLFANDVFISPDSTSFSSNEQLSDYTLNQYGLSSGSQLYAKAYLMSNGAYYNNYNPATGKYELYDKEIIFSNSQTITLP